MTSERNLSLVLGLRPRPEAKVVGFLQLYPADVAQEVLEQLDRREGFDVRKPADELAYLRRPCQVENADGRTVDAVTYLTNPRSQMVDDTLSEESQAMILSGATSEESAGSKARGLFYLEGVRLAFRLGPSRPDSGGWPAARTNGMQGGCTSFHPKFDEVA